MCVVKLYFVVVGIYVLLKIKVASFSINFYICKICMEYIGPVSKYEDIKHVEVPSVTLYLTSQQLMELQQCAHFIIAARTFVNACFY